MLSIFLLLLTYFQQQIRGLSRNTHKALMLFFSKEIAIQNVSAGLFRDLFAPLYLFWRGDKHLW
jgi:hypothetical protein